MLLGIANMQLVHGGLEGTGHGREAADVEKDPRGFYWNGNAPARALDVCVDVERGGLAGAWSGGALIIGSPSSRPVATVTFHPRSLAALDPGGYPMAFTDQGNTCAVPWD